MLSQDAKISIVGAGIVGCSTAYYLTQLGYRNVTLFEAEDVAHAASGRAGGFLARSWCDNGPARLLAQHGFDLHRGLAAELGLDSPDAIGYRPVKTLSLTVTEKDSRGGEEAVALPAWVDGDHVRDAQLIGTLTDTAQVHPGRLTRALWAAAEKAGAQLVRKRVVGVQLAPEGGSANNVHLVRLLDDSVTEAQVVVLAMGPWTGSGLSDWFGLQKGLVRGSRAHSILIRNPPPSDNAAIDGTALFLAYRDNYSAKSLEPEIYPRPDGTVYVCGTGDDAALPDNPGDVTWDEAACRQLERVAARVCGRLTAVEQHSACYLPKTRDGPEQGPLLGSLPGLPGIYMAAGHSCWGILQGPISGKLMAELITSGKTSLDIAAFSPQRLIK